jgi:hypothetical protein
MLPDAQHLHSEEKNLDMVARQGRLSILGAQGMSDRGLAGPKSIAC